MLLIYTCTVAVVIIHIDFSIIWVSELPLDEALYGSLGGERILLQLDLVVDDDRVRLHELLPWLNNSKS